jgi:hypothetical protein
VIRGIPSRRFGARFICIAAGLLAPLAVASDAPPKRPIPWSFAPISSPQVPQLRNASGVTNPIDAFVLNRLEKAGLPPAPRADRLTLLRRAYFDLIGLPPPAEQVEAYTKDSNPDAYEKLIDRLLDSPQYGERWGRHWLDVVRYADTGGFENDHTYPSAWKYRDYVIRSFNDDKRFDRFIEEQVAGDELWPDDKDAVTATAMYCVGPALQESAMISTQLEYEWMTDSADTTGAAFLGLTMGCARCHDHKYDPITQKDYYSLQAVFAASDRPYPDKILLQRIKALNGLLSDAPVPDEVKDDPRCTLYTEDKTGFHLFHRKEPMEVHVLRRGELSKPREAVGPGFPAAVTDTFPDVSPNRRRAALARWLTSDHNPLVARVLVNRVWGWHFGQGIVRTPNDFGAQGEPPTHPDLLDWLASDFVSHGWNLKRLHRQIMLSSTYRMQGIASGRGIQVDPEDRLLWRYPRHRLEGETIRDGLLACAGTLNPEQFGPPVVPPLGSQELTGLFDAKDKWPITKDPSQHTRRSVYVLVRRTFQYPIFAAFDSPELMTSCPRRMQTTVPTQALTLMNSPLAREQAKAFAERLIRECRQDDSKIVDSAFLLAFGRPIAESEKARTIDFLHKRTEAGSAESAVSDLCLALFNANEFVYVD